MEHNTASNTTVCGTDNTSTTECRSISHTDATMTGVQHSIIRTSVELFEESPTLRSDLDRKVESKHVVNRRRARSFKCPCVCDIRYLQERTGCIVCCLDYDSSFTRPGSLAAILLEKVPGSAMENKRATIVYLLSCIFAAALQTGQGKFQREIY